MGVIGSINIERRESIDSVHSDFNFDDDDNLINYSNFKDYFDHLEI